MPLAAARALNGVISHGQIICPGPGHSPRDRSLAVRFNAGGGNKTGEKMMLGSSTGPVVKLSADEEVTTVLGIGEGIETTLSLPMLPECFGIPVWACLSAVGVATFPVLPGIEVLWIAVDNDPSGAGERAAQRCADRWTAAGCEVWLQTPNAIKADINDVIRKYRNTG